MPQFRVFMMGRDFGNVEFLERSKLVRACLSPRERGKLARVCLGGGSFLSPRAQQADARGVEWGGHE
jgi:hypothetical protein